MPSKSLVAFRRLNEDGRLGQALGEHLAADVVEPDALADVFPRLLDHRVPVHVREEAETKSGNQQKGGDQASKRGIRSRDTETSQNHSELRQEAALI